MDAQYVGNVSSGNYLYDDGYSSSSRTQKNSTHGRQSGTGRLHHQTEVHMTIHQYDQTATMTPYERGLDIGQRFRAQVRAAAAEYQEFFRVRGVPEEQIAEMVAGFSAQIADWAPEQLAEIEGLAEGAGVDVHEIVALNARTEIMAAAPPEDDGECSTAVLVPSSGAAPRTVQTWDWKAMLSREMLIRRYRASSGGHVVVFSEFGQTGKIGVNSAGLGIHFNILQHATDASRSGAPVHTVARKILDEASTVEEAVAIAESAPLAASTVITVVSADPGAAACIELSPAGVAVIEASAEVPLVHTNHFIDPALAQGGLQSAGTTTYARYDCSCEIAERVMNIEDPYERASAFTAAGQPMDVVPNEHGVWHRESITKATIVLDLEAVALHYSSGSASRAGRQGWQVFPAAVLD